MNPWPDERAYLTAWWRYGLAIWAWDRGEPQYLAHVVASGYIIPPQLAPIVGDIIGGKRTVNDKAVAKLKAGSIASAVAACRLACARDIERAQRASAKDDGRQARTKSDSAPIAVRRDSDDNREAPQLSSSTTAPAPSPAVATTPDPASESAGWVGPTRDLVRCG